MVVLTFMVGTNGTLSVFMIVGLATSESGLRRSLTEVELSLGLVVDWKDVCPIYNEP